MKNKNINWRTQIHQNPTGMQGSDLAVDEVEVVRVQQCIPDKYIQ